MVDVLDKGKLWVVQSWGDDEMVVKAARVSFNDFETPDPKRLKGLIRFMMANKHGSVFEHCGVTFGVKLPIFVVREWQRHRTQSYNEWSGRYSEIEAEYYIPAPEDVRHQVGKPGAYSFEPFENQGEAKVIGQLMKHQCVNAFNLYKHLLDTGVAKEQARLVLPQNMYTTMYATASLRNWMKFLELRNSKNAMQEIRIYAELVEDALFELFPITMQMFVFDNGRVAP